jgi:glycosyltransferase involved in cell wall biosynthesis
LKRVEVALRTNRPNHFIFESEAMRETAVYGRGIPRRDTSVVHLGIDTERFSPGKATSYYAHDQFGIPHDRRIVFYSGHIQERKGVDVLLRAASEMVHGRGRRDVHFLLVGNRQDEEKGYRYLYDGTGAECYITFGGYRNDVPRLLPSCFLGVIPSTGWDSFTMSSLEMAACGLPLLASRLQGLVEAVDHGRTGYLFEPGDHSALADRIEQLLDDPAQYSSLSQAGRARIEHGFSLEHQLQGLVNAVRLVAVTS